MTQGLVLGPMKVPYRPPALLRREPLRYDLFALVLERLETDLALDRDLLASAFGVDEDDVLEAVTAWRHHVEDSDHWKRSRESAAFRSRVI